MATQLLIVEDDPRIAELVAKNLSAAGFVCQIAHDGITALREFARLQPQLLVLDVMLPGIDGLELTRRIRQQSDVPILLLTARASEGDKVLGFEIGADDYLTKPFSVQELVARVRALLRRTQGHPETTSLDFGSLRIDSARREIRMDGDLIELTSLEFDVLFALASHPGRVYSREGLMQQVWGEDRLVDHRSIDSLISRLRKKLERTAASPRFIQTVWGAGYRFVHADRREQG